MIEPVNAVGTGLNEQIFNAVRDLKTACEHDVVDYIGINSGSVSSTLSAMYVSGLLDREKMYSDRAKRRLWHYEVISNDFRAAKVLARPRQQPPARQQSAPAPVAKAPAVAPAPPLTPNPTRVSVLETLRRLPEQMQVMSVKDVVAILEIADLAR